MSFNDYESLAYFNVPTEPVLVEAYSGTSIVRWYGSIERQLIGMQEQYDNAKNTDYAEKLRAFLQTWRNNPITGSVNIEIVQLLEAAASQNAADPWRLANYFSNLRDQLRTLIASQEELPTNDAAPQPGASAGRRSPRPPADFGPTAAPGGAPTPPTPEPPTP